MQQRSLTLFSMAAIVMCSGIAAMHTRPSDERALVKRTRETDAAHDAAAMSIACRALQRSTAHTVERAWVQARDALNELIGREKGLRARFYWFELYQLDGVFAACGYGDQEQYVILRTMTDAAKVESATLRQVLLMWRMRSCRAASLHTEATTNGAIPWNSSQRTEWADSCFTLLSTTPNGDGGAIVARTRSQARTSPAGTGGHGEAPIACDARALPRLQREATSPERWLVYGRALSNCTPGGHPWRQIGLEREVFTDTFPRSFINSDVARGSLFFRLERARHDRMLRAWRLEG